MEAKSKYLNQIKKGVFVAYEREDGIILSGRVEECQDDSLRFIVKEYNSKKYYLICKSQVIWVRFDIKQRWPSNIFKSLMDSKALYEQGNLPEIILPIK